MNESIEQLITVVAEEAEHCERILVLLRQQQDCLVRGDVDRLQNILQEQEDALRRSHDLEQRRRSLTQQVAESSDIQEQSPSISSLIATLSNDYGRRLEDLRVSMALAIKRVNKTKEQNKLLIERSLSNINEIIHIFAASNVAVSDYADSGGNRTTDTAALTVDRHC